MSEHGVSKVDKVPNLPALLGPRVAVDPPASARVEDLLPHPAFAFERIHLRALMDRYKTVPAFALVGLDRNAVPHIALRRYMEIREFFTNCTDSLAEKNTLAYRAFLLFGHAQRFDAFQRRWRERTRAAHVKDLMKAVHFPPTDTWNRVDFIAWGDLFHEYGVRTVTGLFRRHGADIAPYRDRAGLSLLRTKFNAHALKYKDYIPPTIQQDIDRLAIQTGMNPNEYTRALRIYTSRNDSGERHILPEMYIRGERFGLPGTAFYALDRNDPVKMFIGHFTGCCEKISDQKLNIENTIEHSYLTPRSTFYVVASGEGIIVHSWAWWGADRTLCFDGFESKKDSGFDSARLTALIDEIAIEVDDEKYADFDIGDVCLGECAKHFAGVLEGRPTIPVEMVKPEEIGYFGMNKPGGGEMALIA